MGNPNITNPDSFSSIIEVDNRKVFVNVTGVSTCGKPSIILESGLGMDSSAWKDVQSEVSKFGRVLSYDRAGLGSSSIGSKPRTADKVASELNLLLEAIVNEHNVNFPPPYIICGHSAGGIFAQVFNHNFSEKVGGILFVDSSTKSQENFCKSEHGVYPKIIDAVDKALQHDLELKNPGKVVWPALYCESCTSPLVGDRYLCQMCVHYYNLCAECYPTKAHEECKQHKSDHEFELLTKFEGDMESTRDGEDLETFAANLKLLTKLDDANPDMLKTKPISVLRGNPSKKNFFKYFVKGWSKKREAINNYIDAEFKDEVNYLLDNFDNLDAFFFNAEQLCIKELKNLSEDWTYAYAENSGHCIMFDEPEIIVEEDTEAFFSCLNSEIDGMIQEYNLEEIDSQYIVNFYKKIIPIINCSYSSTVKPLVTLTYAQTLDGYIGNKPEKKEQLLISHKKSMILTHQIRNMNQAILVGINTVLNDNPSLNCRIKKSQQHFQEKFYKVILDSNLKTPLDAKIFQVEDSCKVLLFCLEDNVTEVNFESKVLKFKNTFAAEKLEIVLVPGLLLEETESVKFDNLSNNSSRIKHIQKKKVLLDLKKILEVLKIKFNIEKLMVEGGSAIISQFFKYNLADCCIVTVSPQYLLGGGVHVTDSLNGEDINGFKLKDPQFRQFGDDIVVVGLIQ
ncbi:hypothetical protein HK099_002220 [Clydaea vesicula]|uniref:2,5-diamino-6-ribosylamino-4(3H)-pyrimidinone 5'-phosphate reductase n=1 Tax=Clydaea vesicula TaxID=447962 RepID=A0AAD5U4G2_9FUNG|nr:hypothetical protein HK099_002220 [Clydaea vesicula]KAJ3390876.1 hypothetical protein HDU92_000236 [Lobulomyces angularis]